jgi:hypothetical protein
MTKTVVRVNYTLCPYGGSSEWIDLPMTREEAIEKYKAMTSDVIWKWYTYRIGEFIEDKLINNTIYRVENGEVTVIRYEEA